MKWLKGITNVIHSIADIKKARNSSKPSYQDFCTECSERVEVCCCNDVDANAIHVIHPYKEAGMWIFDDDKKNIVKEPFVSGADEILDFISGYNMKCTVLFSNNCFPGSKWRLNKTSEEGQGAWYVLNQLAANDECREITNIKHGWLCAVVKYYFQGGIPEEIYLQVK